MAKKSGDVIAGRYRLIAPLGKGGMGEVWHATHLALKSDVAVKLLKTDLVDSPEAARRFEREAQAAAALRSTHVVQILDHGIDEGVPYIVMELLEGETLSKKLQRAGNLSPQETLRIMRAITRALSRAHQAGIVHRDIKPENVFLVSNEDEEVVKLLDFGVVKVEAEHIAIGKTKSGALVGTPLYMSPEQVRSKPIDFRSDLWSLAIVTHECICGSTPYDADSLADLIVQITHEPLGKPSRKANVPPGFDEWFAKATARVPEERFQSAKDQLAALEPILKDAAEVDVLARTGSSIDAASMGATTRSTTDVPLASNKRRWPWAIVAIAIASGVAFFFARPNHEDGTPAPTADPVTATTAPSSMPSVPLSVKGPEPSVTQAMSTSKPAIAPRIPSASASVASPKPSVDPFDRQ